ncbi:aldehyde dehydrogenase family protein [Ponticoccus alexandrii]|uniref:Aldehyde dehydrogenase family protein n=1 Tax=Ponticoccus alexandrii TaxID=1943633 RepID=A0ABX7F7N7_9RHOB|nr:aldehyde dehydrogenase family protein [Ponticoccus alexandrii]QRF66161.1 aldehyde dehydrogenase family protein [Ponticoccus alexandrii]
MTGAVYPEAGGGAIDFGVMVGFPGKRDGAALRAMTFNQRAKIFEALGGYFHERRKAFYDLTFRIGGTLADHRIGVEGGLGTIFFYASTGRHVMPGDVVLHDPRWNTWAAAAPSWASTSIGPDGAWLCISTLSALRSGHAGKAGPGFAGRGASVVKTATATCPVTELCVRMMLESGLLPEVAMQLVTGGLGDTLERLDCQDCAEDKLPELLGDPGTHFYI